MKNLKKTIATFGLAAVMMMGVSTANAGIILTDFSSGDSQPCTEQKDDTKTDFTGIILTDFTGIILTDFTGIIIVGAAETPVDCGVIIHN